MRKTLAVGMAGGLLAFFAVAVLVAASTAWGDFIVIPRGTGAGTTGRVRWRELSANGTHSVDWKSPDSLVTTTDYTWPTAKPLGSGYFFTSTAAGVTSWTSPTGTGQFAGCGTVTVPPTTGWTWDNQGGATISSLAAGEYLYSAGAGGNEIRARYRTAPATPYTILGRFIPSFSGAENNTFGGLFFRESSTGKYVLFFIRGNQVHATYRASTASGPGFTGLSGDVGQPFSWGMGACTPMVIKDDGTDRKYGYLDPGGTFMEFFTESRTSDITADQIGFFVLTNSAAAISMYLIDWTVQ